jgi:hypothetical protein
MIDSFLQLTLSNSLGVLYGGIAAAVGAGVVLGVVAHWLTAASRGGDAS